MLKTLQFENFKSWRDTGEIRLAPITGFFGANSSGKTAILQLLLVLKQTVESNDLRTVLNTGDEQTYVDIGTSNYWIHKAQIPKYLKFSISWTPFHLACITNLQDLIRFNPYSANDLIQFQASIHIDNDNFLSDYFQYRYLVDKSHQDSFGLGLKAQVKNGSSGDWRENRYDIFLQGEPLSSWEDENSNRLGSMDERNWNEFFSVSSNSKYRRGSELPLSVSKFYDISGQIPHKSLGNTGLLHNEITLSELADFLISDLEKRLDSIYYLGPLREYPQRLYPWSGANPQDVGKRGELCVAALLAGRRDGLNVEMNVAKWLKKLGLVDSFEVKSIAEHRREYEVLVRRVANATPVPITDVGFGVSQILPVLVLCYYVPEHSTIILEQPEIHLHPSVQAGLADVLIDVVKTRNIQIILESHSEHLLRRLQRRMAEAEIITHEDTALYFCEMLENGESKLNPLEVDEFGNIKNWPENFFGDEMGELLAMTEAAAQRQMENMEQL